MELVIYQFVFLFLDFLFKRRSNVYFYREHVLRKHEFKLRYF